MRAIHRFLSGIEWLGTRRVLGLPLRVILTSDWHRVHFWIIAAGFLLLGIGKTRDWPDVAAAGALVMLPSVACLVVILPLVVAVLGFLGWISGYEGRSGPVRE